MKEFFYGWFVWYLKMSMWKVMRRADNPLIIHFSPKTVLES